MKIKTPEDDLNPYIAGPYAPVFDEIVADDLEIIGEVPEDLQGVYVRNGPNPRFGAQGRHHWFDGDGMLHALHFERGRVTYRNKYVRTDAYGRESRAQEGLWRGLMEPAHHNPRDMPLKDTANTDVIFHNGKLLALWYLAGQPYAVDPVTLETIGAETFGGKLEIDVSAHAKVDPRTGEMFFFDQSFAAPYMSYGVADAAGDLVHVAPIELPGPRQPHDMAITENYAILMDLSLFADPEALAVGRYKVRFHRDIPSRFGILARRGAGDTIRWFDADPCYIYHVVNAWEEGDEIVMIGCRAMNPEPEARLPGPLGRMLAFLRLDAQLYSWRFNLKTGRCKEGPLDDASTEFPTIALSHTGIRSRYCYNAHLSDDPTLLFDGLFKYDLAHGGVERHWFGEGRYGSEAPFVPRVGARSEDDGYLVSFVHDMREDRSEVLILDAANISDEPLARILLPRRVPLGFHATWVDATELFPLDAAAE